MRIKLDENLPQQLVSLLGELGRDIDTVRDEGVAGEGDDAVWRAAQAAGRFLITQDLDFSDARALRAKDTSRPPPDTAPAALAVRRSSSGF